MNAHMLEPSWLQMIETCLESSGNLLARVENPGKGREAADF